MDIGNVSKDAMKILIQEISRIGSYCLTHESKNLSEYLLDVEMVDSY